MRACSAPDRPGLVPFGFDLAQFDGSSGAAAHEAEGVLLPTLPWDALIGGVAAVCMALPDPSTLSSARNTRQKPLCTRQSTLDEKSNGEDDFAKCLFSGTRQRLYREPNRTQQNRHVGYGDGDFAGKDLPSAAPLTLGKDSNLC